MKKLKTLLFFFTLLPTLMFSQQAAAGMGGMNADQNYIDPGNGMANIGGVPVSTDRNLYEGVKGNPMLCKDVVKGFIVTNAQNAYNSKYDYVPGDKIISLENLCFPPPH